jgi:hypothetical protein
VAAKEDLYKWVKLAGILSFIPLVLAGGVIAGYLAGDYIERKFLNLSFAMPAFVVIGLLGSVIEVIRIIKLALKIDRKS